MDRELEMAQNFLSGNVGADMIRRAAMLDQSANHIHKDLESLLFPKSSVIFTDRMLSNSRQYLRSLVSNIESEICSSAVESGSILPESVVQMANDCYGYSYNYLQKSGLLSNQEILDHVFVNVQLAELYSRIVNVNDENAIGTFLDNENPAIADAAMALLAAEARASAPNDARSCVLDAIPAEIFYALVWNVAAAIEHIAGYNGKNIRIAAKNIILNHDESKASRNCAMRLAHLVENSEAKILLAPNPVRDGLPLFFARLEYRTGISYEQLIIFTAEEQMTRLVVVLRAIDINADDAAQMTTLLDVGNGFLTSATYGEIDIEIAKEYCELWASNSTYQSARNSILSLDHGIGS